MPIHVICPHCETRASAPEDSAGKTLSCPHCHNPFTVPVPPRTEDAPLRHQEAPLPPPTRRSPMWDEEERDRPSRYRDDHDDRPRRRDEDYEDRPRRGFRCPYCGTSEPPVIRQQISVAGWVVFAVMLFVCLPLFFIGLLMNEDVRYCRDCGARLG